MDNSLKNTDGEEESKSPTPTPTETGESMGDKVETTDEPAVPKDTPLPLPFRLDMEGGVGVKGDTRPYAVIILRAFGDLPYTGAFSLMTSGFLTDGIPINGASISHVQEEKIREILGMDNENPVTDNIVDINAYSPLSHLDHRLAIEDLVRILPLNAHCLIELSTLPTECVERIIRILLSGERRVIIYRVLREALPDHFPRSSEDLSRITKIAKSAKSLVIPNNQERFTHSNDEEYTLVQDELSSTIGYLHDIGAKTQQLIYNPHDKLVRIGTRVCELLTRDHIRTRGTKRILFEPKELLTDYLEEYSDTGSLREHEISVPIGRGFMNEIVPDKWRAGETDTLVVQPMRVKSGGRSMNITSHTEIVIKEQGEMPFIPLTWHKGDLRTIQIHHEPLSTEARVL